MCGICGFSFTSQSSEGHLERLRTMMASLAHRGPDDSGSYIGEGIALGHQRLSIIDLSAHAKQPMEAAQGRYRITFNGEIYNFLELRQQLVGRGHKFKTSSDTEVILHLFIEEGPQCLQKLNGMFAFAIWDEKERTLFVARDRFGIKPLYYVSNPQSFAFASEIKALLAGSFATPSVNTSSLADYLTFQFCLGEKTLFDQVKKLLPGHWLTLHNGEVTTHKYWDLNFEIDTFHTEEYFSHQLMRLLEDSIRLQLRADVPVGSHLSGGVDSSTVACLAGSLMGEPIHTFTGAFTEGKQFDETAYARLVAKQINSLHHEVFPGEKDFISILPKLIYHLDEPVAGPGVFPQYFVSKLASENVKVVLGGQGGDEIFGGYTRYLIAYLEKCIKGGIEGTQFDNKYVVTFESILPNLGQLQGYKPLLKYFWESGLFEDPDTRYFRLIDRSREVHDFIAPECFTGRSGYSPFQEFQNLFNDPTCKSYINQMTRFDLKTLLPALLQVEDRTSMAVSLESRVPLLDHRIAELAASMPPMVKFKGGRTKHVFRQVVQHVIPQEILDRKDKMGFPVPLNLWYQKGPVRDFIKDILLGKTARNRGLYNVQRVEAMLDQERAFGRGIWGLLCLELWFKTYIDSAPGRACPVF